MSRCLGYNLLYTKIKEKNTKTHNLKYLSKINVIFTFFTTKVCNWHFIDQSAGGLQMAAGQR